MVSIESIIEQLYHSDEDLIYNALPRTLQPGYFFGPHCHQNVELCMMKEGACDIIINGEVITVGRGELLVIFPHMIHSFHVSADRPASFLQMHFKPDIFSRLASEVREGLLFLKYMSDGHSAYLYQPFSSQLLSCVERICAEANDQQNILSGPLSNIYIFEMIFLLSREISQSYRRIFTIDNPIVIQAIQYISWHLEEHVSLADIAAHCRITPRHLSGVFKAAVNLTVADYINILKVDRAMQMLTRTDLSITDIASKLGFSSTQYFSTVFKRYTHVTPKAFRLSTSVEI